MTPDRIAIGIPILDHVWGISRSADRVWAQVSGLAPLSAGKRHLAVFQAFIDDSYNAQEGTFILGGYIAPAEAWAKFSMEWEQLLPYGTLARNGKYHFKMSEMAANPERLSRVPAFIKIIEKHVTLAIACKIHLKELKSVKSRIYVHDLEIDWGFMNYPFMVACKSLFELFHANKDQISMLIPYDEKIDFIFDLQSEKKPVIEAWEGYRVGKFSHLYGATPRFEDDQEFLPLQAADFWAWWVRKWNENSNENPEKVTPSFIDFGNMKKIPITYPSLSMYVREDDLVKYIKDYLWGVIEPGRIIYDIRFGDLPAF